MHWAVSTFGPSWRLENRMVMHISCISQSCSSTPSFEEVIVTESEVDLSDPEVLAAAISKTNAVARTLLTTDGRVLDVTSAGEIPATLHSIQDSADKYRQVFVSKEFLSSPARLGILSETIESSFTDIQPWQENRVPDLNGVPVLTPETADDIRIDTPFKFDPRSKGLILDQTDLRAIESTIYLREQPGQ